MLLTPRLLQSCGSRSDPPRALREMPNLVNYGWTVETATTKFGGSLAHFNGSKWWKVDFHAHSPASFDYGSEKEDEAGPGDVTFDAWLQSYMDAGIDVIVITDHNSSEGIEKARQALNALREAGAPTFRDLTLLAGVEITVASGTHLLAIFDVDTTEVVINDLLVKADYAGVRGQSTKAASKSLSEVARLVNNAGGVAIPAHATGPAGLFKQTGTGWAEVLADAPIVALETSEPFTPGSPAAQSGLIRVLGSDAHHLTADGCPEEYEAKIPGSHFTWIKMSLPNLAGLRNALTDGRDSVVPSDDVEGDPRAISHPWIRSMKIGATEVEFGPWMNALIGGRGVGKSTTVETLRLALDKYHELPPTLKDGLAWFSPEPRTRREGSRIWENGLDISAAYEKDGTSFRIDWDSNTGHAIRELTDATWQDAPGQVRSRFPARIYSQKQIYEMAVHPQALLNIVDSVPEVEIEQWRQKHKLLCDEYRAKVAERQALSDKIASESRVLGEAADLKRKISLFEQLEASTQVEVLRRWELIKSTTEMRLDDLRRLSREFRAASTGITWPTPVSNAGFPTGIQERLASSNVVTSDAKNILEYLLEQITEEENALSVAVESWNLDDELTKARADVLTSACEGDVIDVDKIDELAEWKAQLLAKNRDLDELKLVKEKINVLTQEIISKLDEVGGSRADLTKRRQAVVTDALQLVDNVQVKLVEQGYNEDLELEWRRLVQKESGFETYFTREVLFSGLGDARAASYVLKDLPRLKERFSKIAKQGTDYAWLSSNRVDTRLVTHIRELPDTQVAEFNIWFPEDRVDVNFKADGSNNFKPVAEGSPGQKTAALLALVLSLGAEPLILDQPEDDLDNKLIYSLVVKMLRKIKSKRQVIVVTHNANIVVNGNSEVVSVMSGSDPRNMQISSGSIAEDKVRDAVCLIMEGGEEALRRRFERLQLN